MLNCLTFYLDGEMYTFLYPLDARHPDPPQLAPRLMASFLTTPNGFLTHRAYEVYAQ
jgi:hypothetical protein